MPHRIRSGSSPPPPTQAAFRAGECNGGPNDRAEAFRFEPRFPFADIRALLPCRAPSAAGDPADLAPGPNRSLSVHGAQKTTGFRTNPLPISQSPASSCCLLQSPSRPSARRAHQDLQRKKSTRHLDRRPSGNLRRVSDAGPTSAQGRQLWGGRHLESMLGKPASRSSSCCPAGCPPSRIASTISGRRYPARAASARQPALVEVLIAFVDAPAEAGSRDRAQRCTPFLRMLPLIELDRRADRRGQEDTASAEQTSLHRVPGLSIRSARPDRVARRK